MKAHSTACPRPHGPHGARGEHGAVLIVALILLAVLTLLGVTAMSTTSLEEKMAANTQEGTRAFQIAETGLATAFNNTAAYNLGGFPATATDRVAVNVRLADNTQVGQVRYRSDFNGWSPPPYSALYSATQFHAAHFNFQSDGETWAGGVASGITSRHHGGAYQIAPKQQ